MSSIKPAISLRGITVSILILKVALVAYLAIFIFPNLNLSGLEIGSDFLLFALIGFIAQLIDGALGMAYGVSCSSLLLYSGVPPKVASAAVHIAEIFTTGVSGLSHIRMKNIDQNLFLKIAIPGSIGAAIGAFLISKMINGDFIKPFIAAYLLIMGILILIKGIRNRAVQTRPVKRPRLLAFFGGLLDAIGGGGWGPIVTSNIIKTGKCHKQTIGTVNTAEFFVAFFGTAIFVIFIELNCWSVILGLIVGGVAAAPLGAYLVNKTSKKTMMIAVGLTIIITSMISISKFL
jgi:uncharacterized membrane protein YfcA